MTRFDEDTSFKRLDEHTFERDIDRTWWGDVAPHGGYLSALIQRAMRETVADPARPARSTTLHFLERVREGTVRVTTQVARRGRSLTALTATMEQDGVPVVTAFGTFSAPREAPSFNELTMPEVPAPASLPRIEGAPPVPPFVNLFDYRFACGPMPFSRAETAVAGAWMRPLDGRPVDDVFAAFLVDACVPPVFARFDRPVGVPTIDLSIAFTRALPVSGATDGDFVLGVFRTPAAEDGFIVEDGEIWSEDGRLLVRSRQVALLIPGKGNL